MKIQYAQEELGNGAAFGAGHMQFVPAAALGSSIKACLWLF